MYADLGCLPNVARALACVTAYHEGQDSNAEPWLAGQDLAALEAHFAQYSPENEDRAMYDAWESGQDTLLVAWRSSFSVNRHNFPGLHAFDREGCWNEDQSAFTSRDFLGWEHTEVGAALEAHLALLLAQDPDTSPTKHTPIAAFYGRVNVYDPDFVRGNFDTEEEWALAQAARALLCGGTDAEWQEPIAALADAVATALAAQ